MTLSIGIRELRQHASRYIRRVRGGETIVITDRGEPVAELRPVQPHARALDRLVASGHARAPAADLREFLAAQPPLAPKRGERRLSDVVVAARDDERA